MKAAMAHPAPWVFSGLYDVKLRKIRRNGSYTHGKMPVYSVGIYVPSNSKITRTRQISTYRYR